MKLWVAVYDHPHGRDTLVFATESGANQWRQTLAATWWENEIDEKMPLELNKAADRYFEVMADRADRGEWFYSEECELQP